MLAQPVRDHADSLLSFTVAGQTMAVAAADVAEVGRVPPWTRIPHAPPSLLGVANIRGRVMPVVSLARLLGDDEGQIAAGPTGAAARLLVLAGGAPVGLVVDAVAALGRGDAAQRLDPRALLAREYAALRRHTAAQAPAMSAAPAIEPDHAQDRVALVALRLGGQDYALPLDQVDRVMRPPGALTTVPRSDGAMLGTIAFDGGLLPVVSLAVLLGLPPSDAAEVSARILIASIAGQRVGLLVDRVTGTIEVRRDNIDAVPPLLTRGAAEAQIAGICRLDGGRLEGGRRLVCLLSTSRLFDAHTTQLLRSSGQQEPQRMPASTASDDARETFVIFRLGDEAYGLPIAAVHEVARYPEHLARVPDAPDFVAGIMSLRGRAVPVIDTARRFGAAAGGQRSRRVIVVSAGGVTAGLAVDAVTDVLSFPTAALQPAPDFEAEGAVFDRIAVRSADRMILLISPKGVIEAAERDLLAALAEVAQAKLPPVS